MLTEAIGLSTWHAINQRLYIWDLKFQENTLYDMCTNFWRQLYAIFTGTYRIFFG